MQKFLRKNSIRKSLISNYTGINSKFPLFPNFFAPHFLHTKFPEMKTSSPIFSVFFSVFCNIVSGLDSGVHNPGPELNVKLRDLAGGVGVGGFNPLLVDDKVRDDSDRGRSGDGVDIRGDPGHSVGNADDARWVNNFKGWG